MSKQTIVIWGEASKKVRFEKEVLTSELELTLLKWVQNNNIPMASSCLGNGLCQKCIYNEENLACKVTLSDLSKINARQNKIIISISYL